MEYCFKCKTPETVALLFEGIASEGVMKICGKCYSKDKIPLVKHNFQGNKESEQTVRNRLSKLSGTDVGETSFNIPKKTVSKTDLEIKSLAERNYQLQKSLVEEDELVDNFHWVVMRGRRFKHLTKEQLAKAIFEPEAAIREIEKKTPPKNHSIIDKLEEYLEIKIRKNPKEEPKEKTIGLSGFGASEFSDVSIADLNEMKRKQEEGYF